jgi:hypothetical protein
VPKLVMNGAVEITNKMQPCNRLCYSNVYKRVFLWSVWRL